MDIRNLCRSCMSELTQWNSKNVNTRAVDMFSFCTNIKVTDEDKLPKQFCNNCMTRIESSYAFIVQAQRVDITLKNFVSRSGTSVIVQLDNHKHETFNILNIKYNLLPNHEVCSDVENYDDLSVNESTKSDCSEISKNQVKIEGYPVKIETNTKQVETTERNVISKHINDSNTKTDVCPICRKSFVSKIWFSKHMESDHSDHTCNLCSKTFTRLSHLTSHLSTHSKERKYECTSCSKSFKLRKQLTVHIRKHNGARPFECDKCAMRFKCKTSLKCHMKVHEASKQYLCSFCGSSFAQAGNLHVHIRTHTGDRPFKCNKCQFSATSASNLTRHSRIHSGLLRHLCRFCQKGFIDAAALTRHTRIHTGELPYRCPLCARAFLDSWKRKTHLMRAHKMALEQIPRMNAEGKIITK